MILGLNNREADMARAIPATGWPKALNLSASSAKAMDRLHK
ncbi:hypothetical protein [Arthrobacter alpinus]|nr:hypothetical protein [Arthrobacter alpinus]